MVRKPLELPKRRTFSVSIRIQSYALVLVTEMLLACNIIWMTMILEPAASSLIIPTIKTGKETTEDCSWACATFLSIFHDTVILMLLVNTSLCLKVTSGWNKLGSLTIGMWLPLILPSHSERSAGTPIHHFLGKVLINLIFRGSKYLEYEPWKVFLEELAYRKRIGIDVIQDKLLAAGKPGSQNQISVKTGTQIFRVYEPPSPPDHKNWTSFFSTY